MVCDASARLAPPVELSTTEQAIVARVRRAKLFVFLRRVRRELFSPAFQAELAAIYADSARGHPPIPPAQLGLATIPQAYPGVSDAEVIEALTMDRRWQLVLDCLDGPRAPVSKPTLVRFRAALLAHDLDRRLIERTVELAERDRDVGLQQLRAALEAVERAVAGCPELTAPASVAAARQVAAQDLEAGPVGAPGCGRVWRRTGASRWRTRMRHGRKSRSERVDGYKRHALRDLDRDEVRAVGVTAANVPDAAVTDAIAADLVRQPGRLVELHIDRGYLSSRLVRERPAELAIYCKALPVHAGEHFPKTAFTLGWTAGTLRRPGGVTIPGAPGATVHLPTERHAACHLRPQCTGSAQGRNITLHPNEQLLAELRARQQTAAGRAQLRERVAVEHTLAHLGRWQGWRVRYRGERKNLFDLRRVAVVHNLYVLQPAAAHQEDAT